MYQIAVDEAFPPRGKTNHNRYEYAVINSGVRIPGEKSLLVAVIEQAIVDYFILVRRKAIKYGELTGKIGEHRQDKRSKSTGEHYMTHSVGGMTANDMRELINFIKVDAQRYAEAADLDMDISALWRKILLLERSGRFRKKRARQCTTIDEDICDGQSGALDMPGVHDDGGIDDISGGIAMPADGSITCDNVYGRGVDATA